MQANAVQTWNPSISGNMRWCVRLFPSLTDFAFVLPAVLLFRFLNGPSQLLKDGDTGWHIRTGEWILHHGTVPTVDLFSYTKPHQSWFAWEWGWDVLFAFVHRTWGLAGVVFINVCLLCIFSALLFRLVRRCCGDDVLSFAFTLAAICASTIHWLARPHLISWLFFVIFMHVLLTAETGTRKILWLLPVLTVFWVNLHGGFVAGILLVSLSALGEFAKAVLSTENSFRSAYAKSRPYLLCAAACAAASLANPYGWHLDQHIVSYLQNAKLLDHIAEFQSVSFHAGGMGFFESLLVCGAGAIWWCLERGRLTEALWMLAWAHLALFSGRNIPLFVMVASPWAACLAQDLLGRVAWAPRLANIAAEIRNACLDLKSIERVERLHVASMLAVLLLAVLFASGSPGFAPQFDSKEFSIEMVPEFETLAKSRIFTYDQWADILIYRFPESKVFMDGRSDFYGADFVDKYLKTIDATYNWESNLANFGVNTVIVKPDAPLATVLKESGKWRIWFDNGSVIVFTSRASDRYAHSATRRLRVSTDSPVRRNGSDSREPERVSESQLTNQERRSL